MAHNHSLEAELLAFLRPDETAAELLVRTFVEPFMTGVALIDHHVSFRPGNVLEVAGAAGAGKTELLVQIAVTCILPSTLHGVHYGGRAENVLLFDLDCKVDGLRVLQLLHARAGQSLAAFRGHPAQEAELEAVVQDSLQRLHLVRCHSSFDFLAALTVARPLLAHLAAAGGGIRCLLVDNVAAFHYLDRVGRGPAAGAGAGGAATVLGAPDVTRDGAPLTLHRVQAAAARELRSLAREHRLAVVATKNLIMPAGRDAERGDLWAHREMMLKPWQDLVTHRLMLRVAPPPGASRYQQQQEVGAGPQLHLSKWLEPAGDAVTQFQVAEGGLVLV